MTSDKDVVKLLKTRKQNEARRELDSVLAEIGQTLDGIWPHLSSIAKLLEMLEYPDSCGPLNSQIVKLYSGEEKATWSLSFGYDSSSNNRWHIREDGSLWKRKSSCNCCWVYYRHYFNGELARIDKVACTSVLPNPEEGKLSSYRWTRHELVELLRAIGDAHDALRKAAVEQVREQEAAREQRRLADAEKARRREAASALKKLRQEKDQVRDRLQTLLGQGDAWLSYISALLKTGQPRFPSGVYPTDLPGGSYGWQLEEYDWSDPPFHDDDTRPPIGASWYLTTVEEGQLIRVDWSDPPCEVAVPVDDYGKKRLAEVNQAMPGSEEWLREFIRYCEEMQAVFTLVQQRYKELGGR